MSVPAAKEPPEPVITSARTEPSVGTSRLTSRTPSYIS